MFLAEAQTNRSPNLLLLPLPSPAVSGATPIVRHFLGAAAFTEADPRVFASNRNHKT